MDELILARHAESEYNVRRACNGDPSLEVPLTEAGRAQARRLGELLAGEQLDLCVTSTFPRVRETAELALAHRAVPCEIEQELDDPWLGELEGCSIEVYQAFTREHPPEAPPPGAGESRADNVRRYVRAFARLAARPERRILVVAHGLPIHYLVRAADGESPGPAVGRFEHATPVPLDRSEVERGLEVLRRWCEAPAW